jgi:xanthine dehydrogenase accessory factor
MNGGVGRAGAVGALAVVRAALAAVDRGESAVVATVVGTERSVPRHAGARMLVHPDGRQLGTIGGGEMEARVIAAALDTLTSGAPRLVTFDLVDPGAGDPGVCGGTVSISLEPFMPESNIVVIGCGHVGRALAELAHWLGYRVTALDDRPGLASPAQVPGADDVLGGPLADTIAAAPITAGTHVVLVTRNMAVDLEALPPLLATPARSIGVLGSRRRWGITRQRLLDDGVDEQAIGRVRSPVGIDIAAETPEQIAVSIMAEIVALG